MFRNARARCYDEESPKKTEMDIKVRYLSEVYRYTMKLVNYFPLSMNNCKFTFLVFCYVSHCQKGYFFYFQWYVKYTNRQTYMYH